MKDLPSKRLKKDSVCTPVLEETPVCVENMGVDIGDTSVGGDPASEHAACTSHADRGDSLSQNAPL